MAPKLALAVLLAAAGAAGCGRGSEPKAADDTPHEYAPIERKQIDYEDWTFADVSTGAPVNLRDFARGKRLVLVVYFAPWCPNWRYEAPFVARLYDAYRDAGFDVVAVSNYGSRRDIDGFFAAQPAPYPVVVESESRDARLATTHYAYRTRSGDGRKWGSPYNVFLVPDALDSSSAVVAHRTWVANGELVEAEAEAFVRERLGPRTELQLSQADDPAPSAR